MLSVLSSWTVPDCPLHQILLTHFPCLLCTSCIKHVVRCLSSHLLIEWEKELHLTFKKSNTPSYFYFYTWLFRLLTTTPYHCFIIYIPTHTQSGAGPVTPNSPHILGMNLQGAPHGLRAFISSMGVVVWPPRHRVGKYSLLLCRASKKSTRPLYHKCV